MEAGKCMVVSFKKSSTGKNQENIEYSFPVSGSNLPGISVEAGSALLICNIEPYPEGSKSLLSV